MPASAAAARKTGEKLRNRSDCLTSVAVSQ